MPSPRGIRVKIWNGKHGLEGMYNEKPAQLKSCSASHQQRELSRQSAPSLQDLLPRPRRSKRTSIFRPRGSWTHDDEKGEETWEPYENVAKMEALDEDERRYGPVTADPVDTV